MAFGTSGLRGLVTDITDLEAYINVQGFLEYLSGIGELKQGESVCIGGDLRPSTNGPDRSIMRAVGRAIDQMELKIENLGTLPTPALMFHAMLKGRPSVMVTGSHIPFDRNGIKFNKKSGELLKADEPGVLEAVARVRHAEYSRPESESLFGQDGMFKATAARPLPRVNDEARRRYLRRYIDFFPPRVLEGRKIVVFEHSAVGRDLLAELLQSLGAQVVPVGRCEQFVAIDTENVTAEQLRELQEMVDEVRREHASIDAVLSTDGDSDRPLMLGIEPDGTLRFIGGDLLGILVADYLAADSVSIPISANDAVDIHFTAKGVQPTKTRIGSPYVIEAMTAATSQGQHHVVGWEANGGFMTGSPITKGAKGGRTLAALPTRDACLPLLAPLHAAIERQGSLVELFAGLPSRFSKAGLIDEFPVKTSRAVIQRYAGVDDRVYDVMFEGDSIILHFKDGQTAPASKSAAGAYRTMQNELSACFNKEAGFDDIVRINTIDGVRILFSNADIAHVRPSGNAPQLRIYAVADTQQRADQIVHMGVTEPDGLLRKLESTVSC